MTHCQDDCAAPMRETQVRAQLEFLNNAIMDNDSTVRELMHRLDMVIEKQEEEEKKPSAPALRQKLVDHAVEIRSFGERISSLTTDVRATLDHLEL